MEIMGIRFAPLNIPLSRRMETLSAALTYISLTHLIWMAILVWLYLFLTSYWIISVIYIVWMFVLDCKTPEKGGRRSEWFRSLSIFEYAKNYFPVKVHLQPGAMLDPTKNYIVTYFPHGVIALGAFLSYSANLTGTVQKVFPSHTLYSVTLKQSFIIPLYREFLLAMGFISATAESINYLLSQPEAGNVVGIIVGGAAEAFGTQPGQYSIVVRNRKGFVKLALKNGSPIVPVYSFGENDLFNQAKADEGSFVLAFQKLIKRILGFAPIVVYGRGFFQYSFGFLPFRRPVNVVVGAPIEVEKDENPTLATIDVLHEKFMARIQDIFETYKHEFLQNPEEQRLIIL